MGEGFVAGAKPFCRVARRTPVAIFTEIQIRRGVLNNNGHGLSMRDFVAQGAVGEAPRESPGGKRPDRRASNRAALVSHPTHLSLALTVRKAGRDFHGVRFYAEGPTSRPLRFMPRGAPSNMCIMLCRRWWLRAN